MCPFCRSPLSESKVCSAPFEPLDSAVPSFALATSSKVFALLKILVAPRNKDPSTKSVVFSKFSTMLILLEELLKKAGFKILRLDGSMHGKKRAKVIQDFTDKGLGTILLASLMVAAGMGINLIAALEYICLKLGGIQLSKNRPWTKFAELSRR